MIITSFLAALPVAEYFAKVVCGQTVCGCSCRLALMPWLCGSSEHYIVVGLTVLKIVAASLYQEHFGNPNRIVRAR